MCIRDSYGPGFGGLYPVYVRGLAYARLGRHTDAAAEFQKILDHPGLMLNLSLIHIYRTQRMPGLLHTLL